MGTRCLLAKAYFLPQQSDVNRNKSVRLLRDKTPFGELRAFVLWTLLRSHCKPQLFQAAGLRIAPNALRFLALTGGRTRPRRVGHPRSS